MPDKLLPITSYNRKLNTYLNDPLDYDVIYQSAGLRKHIEKRHPECLRYLSSIKLIIDSPDYIGVNPNETGTSFELVKILDNNVQVGIKLDAKNDYLYIATLHTITQGKLEHGLRNGRLKKI